MKVSLSNELIEGILFPIVGAVIFALAAFLVPELVSIWSPKKRKIMKDGWCHCGKSKKKHIHLTDYILDMVGKPNR